MLNSLINSTGKNDEADDFEDGDDDENTANFDVATDELLKIRDELNSNKRNLS